MAQKIDRQSAYKNRIRCMYVVSDVNVCNFFVTFQTKTNENQLYFFASTIGIV